MAEETKEETKAVEVPKKFAELVKQIEEMSVLELSELVKVFEEKFGVSATPVAVAGAAVTAEATPVEEKTSFNVELTSVGEQKVAVIKAVKDIAGLGLKDAKDLVDKAPSIIKENVAKEEAEEMKSKIEVAGGQVELK